MFEVCCRSPNDDRGLACYEGRRLTCDRDMAPSAVGVTQQVRSNFAACVWLTTMSTRNHHRGMSRCDENGIDPLVFPAAPHGLQEEQDLEDSRFPEIQKPNGGSQSHLEHSCNVGIGEMLGNSRLAAETDRFGCLPWGKMCENYPFCAQESDVSLGFYGKSLQPGKISRCNSALQKPEQV